MSSRYGDFGGPVGLWTHLGKKEKELFHNLTYWTDGKNRGIPVCVPTQFWTDGGSIPAAAWAVVGHPFSSDGLAAYVVHDYLYRGHRVLDGDYTQVKNAELKIGLHFKVVSDSQIEITRAGADLLLYRGLRVLGMKKWRAKAIYYAVRSFGWMSWKN